MRTPARTPSVLVLLMLLIVAVVAGGCGDDDGSKASTSKSDRAADRTDANDEPEGGNADVEANLEVKLERMGDKSSGAGIPIPSDLACTRSIPATCRAEHVCPATEPAGEGICAWLATDEARDLLLKQPPAAQACTQQYGGAEVATVTGTYDGRDVDVTFSRTNGCEIGRFDSAAPLWTRELAATFVDGGQGDAAGGGTSAMCVAEDPDTAVSSDDPPVPCDDTTEPDEISDPPEAFDR